MKRFVACQSSRKPARQGQHGPGFCERVHLWNGASRNRFPTTSSSAGRIESGVEFLDEFLQLLSIDVADGKKFETLSGPAPNVESLLRLIWPMVFRACTLRDEEIDYMRSAR